MESLKKLINVLVMVYLLIAFLFLLRILSVSKFVALFDLADAAMFYNRLLWAGAVLLLAELLVENAYIAVLKRSLERERQQHTDLRTKHTELKAKHYDQQIRTTAASPSIEPAAPAVSQRSDATRLQDQAPIITPAPMPPTLNPQENPNLPPTDHRPFV